LLQGQISLWSDQSTINTDPEENSLFDMQEPEAKENLKHRSDGDFANGPQVSQKQPDPEEEEQFLRFQNSGVPSRQSIAIQSYCTTPILYQNPMASRRVESMSPSPFGKNKGGAEEPPFVITKINSNQLLTGYGVQKQSKMFRTINVDQTPGALLGAKHYYGDQSIKSGANSNARRV
jgi:hypothetical protein